jgi:integrase
MKKTDEKKIGLRGMGRVYHQRDCKTWMIQYYDRGSRIRESTGTTDKKKALDVLKERLGEVVTGTFAGAQVKRVRVSELATAFLDSQRMNKAKGAKHAEQRWKKHLDPYFGRCRAADLRTDHVWAYTKKRSEAGAANATINRELASLKRVLNFARKDSPPKIRAVPHIPMLKEDNARKGFVELGDFLRLTAQASELWLRTFLEIAFTYGWRKSEILGLRVRQLNFTSRTIRLDPGTTKNGEGREVVMTAKVEALLRAAAANKKPDDFVLTRKDGSSIKNVRKAWYALCIRAGFGSFVCRACDKPMTKPKCDCGSRDRQYRGLIPHDLRRSAAKALRAAGVPESVVMEIGGWKTRAMFMRYAIVSNADQRAAVNLLERAREALGHDSAMIGQKSDSDEAGTTNARLN